MIRVMLKAVIIKTSCNLKRTYTKTFKNVVVFQSLEPIKERINEELIKSSIMQNNNC